ncbi:MAG TPA: 6,7-dimethyl-8-ribityllumazine synthase [Candidatus Limnocylindria bacterium]|jgi:6,7-dimethyl-8-ribityllumazine synthase|nr:6,7-dimethyl-8-ribityllumazine synthase [Candidatus Limnocylindria bacterium]
MAKGKTRAGGGASGARGARVAIVRARWNEEVTLALERGAIERATAAGARIDMFEVAGSFELPAAVALLADSGRYDAVVPIGCLIRGETPHFEFLAQAVAKGVMDLSLTYPTAIPFAVLTCETIEQARERAGGSVGNVGAEAMDAALELVALRQALTRARSSTRRSSRRASTASKRSAR